MKFGLVLLLLLLNYSSAQVGNCDYYQQVTVGVTYYINSPNYPQNYRPGVQCRWIASCPSGYNCRLDCPDINIPQSTSCSLDRLLVSRSGDPNLSGAETYCGTGSLTGVLSINQQLSVGLISSGGTGGRFQCTLKAQAITAPPSTCPCGVRRQNRIVGGQVTGVNEFTMMAGLADRTNTIYCGATIISSSYLVTAAHCTKGKLPQEAAIVVGEHDTTTGDSPATKAYAISLFIQHPGFTETNYDNDISVVKVAQPMVFSDLVRPVCLPFRFAANNFAGTKVIALGWGTLFIGGPTSNALRMVDLDVLTQTNCISRGAPVTDRQMCTFTSGKDSCQNDSGGPLLWTDPSTGALQFVGIISYGRYCASTTPGISTRVTSHLNWILSVTNTTGTSKDYCIR